MSSNKADFNLRETVPLSRNTLHTCEVTAHEFTRQRTNPMVLPFPKGCRDGSGCNTRQTTAIGHLIYPIAVRDTAERGMGCLDNGHLNYLAESIDMNVGGFHQDVKMSRPSNLDESVGGVIVV